MTKRQKVEALLKENKNYEKIANLVDSTYDDDRPEAYPIKITETHKRLVKFLNKELKECDAENMKFYHWYERDYYELYDHGPAYEHSVNMLYRVKCRFLFFSWTSEYGETIAKIISEPDTPIPHGQSDGLTIALLTRKPEIVQAMQKIAEKFQQEFHIRATIHEYVYC